jgi:hypothetical protein
MNENNKPISCLLGGKKIKKSKAKCGDCDYPKVKGVFYIKADSQEKSKRKFELYLKNPTKENAEELGIIYIPDSSK